MPEQVANNPKKQSSLWKNKNFLLIWGGSAISGFGMQMYVLAIPLLIYEISQSALAMSSMRAIEFLPNILIGMFAGVLVDRLDRKKIMWWMSMIRVIVMGALIVLLISGKMEIWHLYILGFLLTSSGYTFGNAQHSVLPQIMTHEQLTSANAKMSFVGTIIGMIGPGLAGALIAAFSFTYTLTITLMSSLVLVLCMSFFTLPENVGERKQNSKIWEDIKEGIHELFQNKTLLTPTIAVLFNNLASSLVIGVLVFFTADKLGATSTQIGYMFTISTIGGLAAASAISPIRKRWGRGNIFTFALLTDAIALICMIFASVWWAIGIALAVRTFAATVSNIVYFTIRQEFTPNHLLGRVAGTSSMLMKLATPLGMFIAGLWAEWLPIRILFLIAALIILGLFLRLFVHPFRKLV